MRDRKPRSMTATSFTSCSEVTAAVVLITLFCSAMAPVSCPHHLQDKGVEHGLDSAFLFDGDPANKADLIPVDTKNGAVWDLTQVDPYLVCHNKNTTHVITLRGNGAKSCGVLLNPFRAFCR